MFVSSMRKACRAPGLPQRIHLCKLQMRVDDGKPELRGGVDLFRHGRLVCRFDRPPEEHALKTGFPDEAEAVM